MKNKWWWRWCYLLIPKIIQFLWSETEQLLMHHIAMDEWRRLWARLLSGHLCLFLELVVEDHMDTRMSLGFPAFSLPIKWNMRARGCVWDMEMRRGGNNSDARTQNKKYIQILHFRKDKNILIHKCCFYSRYYHFNSF